MPDQRMQVGSDISPDGRWMIYSQRTARGDGLDVGALDGRRFVPFQHSDADEASGAFLA